MTDFPIANIGQEIAALLDPNVGDVLAPEERPLLAALLSQDSRIDIAIPADALADDLWRAVLLCSRVLASKFFTRIDQARNILKLLIGRALVLMQTKPELYERRGFRSLDAMMSDETNGLPALLGISRGELYKLKSIAEKNPTLPLPQYRKIGVSKLGLISRVTQEGNANYSEWLERAENSTFAELKASIEASDMQIPEGSLTPAVFTLSCNEDQKRELEAFLDHRLIQAKNNTRNGAEILVNCTRECFMEWVAAGGQTEEGPIS